MAVLPFLYLSFKESYNFGRKVLDNVSQSRFINFQIPMRKQERRDFMAHIGVRIPREEKEQLAEIAEITDQTISDITRDLLKKYLTEEIKIVLK